MKFFTLAVALFCIFANVRVYAEVTHKISLKAEDWDASQKGAGLEVYNDGDNLVLGVVSFADPPWQGAVLYVVDLDLDTYPNGRIHTLEESTGEWNIKLFAPGLGDQTSPLGGDQSTYGERTFLVENVTGQTGVSSFEIWLWVIGQGTDVTFDNLEFFGEGDTGMATPKNEACIFHAEKGKLVFNSASDKPVAIYTVDGKLAKQLQANTNTTVDLNSGVYIVKVGTTSLKVLIP